jgi:hypothetical protein
MTWTATALDDLGFVSALLDLVLPPNPAGDVPGAGALGLGPAVVQGVKADRLIGPMVEAGVEAVRDEALSQHAEGLSGMSAEEGVKLVQSQLLAHPVLMMGILRYLYPVYYAHPLVLAAIGEPARAPFPEGFDIDPIDEGLLEKLRARRKTE